MALVQSFYKYIVVLLVWNVSTNYRTPLIHSLLIILSIIPDLRIAFDLLDRNRDGQVTTREFKIMLNNLGIDLKEDKVEELIRFASHAGKVC